MLNKGCVTVTLQNFGGTLEGIEPSVSSENKDVFPLHYKIWGVESWEDSNLHFSYQKVNVIPLHYKTSCLTDYKGVFLCYLIHV